MQFIHTVNSADFIDTLVSLAAAFVLGTLIGAERQYRQRTAGLRTNVLVAVGAASFVDLGFHLGGSEGAVRVIAYVVSGIGFLGAGVIMKEGLNVRGLNTAATVWCSGAVGACAGADLVAQAGLLTAFVLGGNTLLRPLANAIDRLPLHEGAAEATYEVTLLAAAKAADALQERMTDVLEAASYPVGDVEESQRADGVVALTATLVSTAVNPHELDAVVRELRTLEGVAHAAWSGSTRD